MLARQVQKKTGQQKLSSGSTILCAGVAGGLAGMVGNPTEVVLVRMCADGVKSPAQRYLYPNAISGMYRIGHEEGLKAFTKGLGPNIVRSVLMSKLCLLIIWKYNRQKLTAHRHFTDCCVCKIELNIVRGTRTNLSQIHFCQKPATFQPSSKAI